MGDSGKGAVACEYVIGISDESWRDAIEAFLGPRRYSILVEPLFGRNQKNHGYNEYS